MNTTIKLSTFVLPALLLFASGNALAAAEQCQEDSDCSEGSYCAKGASSPGCDGGDCGVPEIIEEEYGTCEVAPVSCTSDADCDEYLSCVDSDSTTCWDGPDGSGCDEPDPDAPKYCGVAVISCSSDADCPREFECVSHTKACPEIACADDAPDCRPCESATYESCQPKQIACEQDSDCPTDWSCGAGSGSGGGSDDVAEPAPAEPAMDLPGTRTKAEGSSSRSCYPNAFGAWDATTDEAAGADSSGNLDDRNNAGAESGSPSSSGGGCSVGAVGASGAAGWLMTLFLVGPLAWRRKRG